MKRLAALCSVFALTLSLLTMPVQAIILPYDVQLFTSEQPQEAIAQLEERLDITITDKVGVDVSVLHTFETAINYISTYLFREAMDYLTDTYGVELEVIFSPDTGQEYLGITTLRANRNEKICIMEFVSPTGFELDTMVHELCHLINYAMEDDVTDNIVESYFYKINNGVPYQDDFQDSSSDAWQQYIKRLNRNIDSYFIREYGGTDVYEDFACLFEAVVQNSDYWEEMLLKPEYAPLLEKYTTASALITKHFRYGYYSPLTDLYPDSWAIPEWQEARALSLVPRSLDWGYDQPITRRQFCQLAVNFLAVWLEDDPSEAVRNQGISIPEHPFTDTDDKDVELLAGLGVVNGIGDGKFGPNQYITRQEAAKLLSNLAQAAGIDLNGKVVSPVFSDSGTIASWAQESVAKVAAAGLMGSTGNGAFSPNGTYDHQQSFLTILRLYKLL